MYLVGPLVTMMGKMVKNMIYFVVLLLVVLLSFGVARQAILNPNAEAEWHIIRNVRTWIIFHLTCISIYFYIRFFDVDRIPARIIIIYFLTDIHGAVLYAIW